MILAIDPGAIHVGVAEFIDHGNYAEEVKAYETTPDGLYRILADDDIAIETVVCEEFRLYPWAMKEQGFSPIQTVEVIGVIKHLCLDRKIKLVMQSATIKRPTEGILRSLMKGTRLLSHGQGPHARDAEVHGWYYFRHYLKGEK